jgi:hypothetical protein
MGRFLEVVAEIGRLIRLLGAEAPVALKFPAWSRAFLSALETLFSHDRVPRHGSANTG